MSEVASTVPSGLAAMLVPPSTRTRWMGGLIW